VGLICVHLIFICGNNVFDLHRLTTMTLQETTQSHPPSPTINRGERNMNPPGVGFLALLREDLHTHGSMWEQGFWALSVHRFGNWRMGLPKPIRFIFTLLYRFLYKWAEITCGITLPYTVIVGRRVRIWHHGGMILHARSIGDDVHIRQNTTFGIARKDQLHELPIIEERVDIGCGVAILGAVRVGHDSAVGANAVVLKDVPPWSVAVGVPAKIVKTMTPP
jgi:serine O-acetyltransferase